MPRVQFRHDEMAMLDELTSLNFARFLSAVSSTLKEKFLLYKVVGRRRRALL